MELKIYNPQDEFLQKIEWNFEELKAEISEAAQGYETAVYTDESIKQAKADRAKLNKFVTALEDKRKEVKKQMMEPYNRFEQEVKALIEIVTRASSNIDSQVKDYEERCRREKADKVREFYEENIHDLKDILPFDRVFRPEYALAATTMKSVKEDILALIQRVDEGLAVLNEVDSKYAGDMKAVFLKTYDIGQAMAERNRLEEAERRRQEYEAEQTGKRVEKDAQIKADAARVMSAGQGTAQNMEEKKPEVQTPPTDVVEDPVHIIDFRVRATKGQLDQLKLFLVENRIQFGPVPKEGK